MSFCFSWIQELCIRNGTQSAQEVKSGLIFFRDQAEAGSVLLAMSQGSYAQPRKMTLLTGIAQLHQPAVHEELHLKLP